MMNQTGINAVYNGIGWFYMIENYKVIEILLELLSENKQTAKFYYCLNLVCEQTLTQYQKGIEYEGAERYQMKRVYDDIKGNKRNDSKADNKWLNETDFKKYCQKLVEQHIERFREIGFIPVINTTEDAVGKGNKKLFWLETREISHEENQMEDDSTVDISKINYDRAPSEQIKLAFYIKPFFKNGELKNRSFKSLGFFVSWMGISYFALAMLFIVAYSTVLIGNQYITFQILNLLFLGLLAFLSIKYVFIPFLKLPEYRVIKAPLLMLGWNEYHAEIEMHRDFKEQRTRFTRFTADCPICSGEIALSNGEKDYNLALVGRCSESPLLHVYSFDRALLKGKLLSSHIVL